MKFRFESNLPHQTQAIESVCDLFRGQEVCRSEFTVVIPADQNRLGFYETDLGVGNRLTLLDDEIVTNLNNIQLRNGLAPSTTLDSGDFTVEMETGTGKTYVYLRTIFELNKRYGFTKFVIVVPSIAIKEGVHKSIRMMEDHFRGLYAGVPFDHFLYDSSKLGQVRNFATSPKVQIMVVTVGSINKEDVNNLYKDSEKTGGEKPIDLIKATRPVVIVDEPQSVDGGMKGSGKKALEAMHPLCTLRYSATHVDKHHMVYRLDAVDAYEQKLVKQIEVASATVEGDHNKPYVKLIATSNKRNVISAKVELDVLQGNAVRRQEKMVYDGDDLEQVTGRPVYQNSKVGEIVTKKGKEAVELRIPGSEVWLSPGESYGSVEDGALKRQLINRTIREHLEKELRLAPLGIKVLSLFFIDRVDKYRDYDADGIPRKGEYALMFEEEYRRLARNPQYRSLFKEVDLETDAEAVHNGYFSIDKKGLWSDTTESNQTGRDNAERAYDLIMKEKEKLVSFETKLKFIFSHSALKEGWDNPNVFQICVLRDMGTELQRRQTIGRGLRLCVNQQGERLQGFDVNTLTVIATESYEQFAENLQKEIEVDTGLRFGVVEKHQFASVWVKDSNGTPKFIGISESERIWSHLRDKDWIDAKGRVQDTLRTELKNGTFRLPEEFASCLGQVSEVLKRLSGRLEVKNADERKTVRTRRAVLDSEQFRELWNRIKHKTTYRVMFDNDELIRKCTQAIGDAQPVAKTRLQWRKADLSIGESGVRAKETATSDHITIEESDLELPDLLTELQDKTDLTRRSLATILIGTERLDDFKKNPQQFITICAESINRAKRMVLVDGIKYQRIGNEAYYAQELFETEELKSYMKSVTEAKKSVYEYVVYDSEGTEKAFAEQLERNEAVKVYAKLPGWFKVPTPLGSYNPDWAILVDRDGGERLYFVVETKSTLFDDELRDRESAKIECGKAHFKALANGDNPARFILATHVNEVLEN